MSIEFLHENAIAFYNFLLEEEYNFFQRHKVGTAIMNLRNLEGMRKNGDFLLRIGKHQGFLGITIMLILKKASPGLYKRAYKSIVPIARYEVNKARKVTQEGRILGWCRLVQG